MNRSQILLVEDNPIDKMMFERALKHVSKDVEVLHFESVQEACRYVENVGVATPRLAVLDLRLGDETGFDYLRKRNQSSRLHDVPAIILSTSDSNKDVKEAFSLGAAGYFVKPLEFKELTELIASITSYWDWSVLPGDMDS
ncbi:MAG: response regulator [Planctomycetota bacterium]